ncbi:hypothetical protein DFH08DRAFT_946004 [Mycena albidolilacea]|uniref:Uncharacterized protein n=1 Tax=Mycena albidolilacea TaxID=1033008 RepID=A0AAD7E795_9AGAR|nr:hypothetical protein DFH08DRAFT_946004 [Mycena albidolilacea]
MSLPSLDTVTDALLVGTWVNSLLYTVEIIQVARYYHNFKSDGWMLKLFVGFTCAVDALGMIGNYTLHGDTWIRTIISDEPILTCPTVCLYNRNHCCVSAAVLGRQILEVNQECICHPDSIAFCYRRSRQGVFGRRDADPLPCIHRTC